MKNTHAAQLAAKAPVEFAAVEQALANTRAKPTARNKINLEVRRQALCEKAPMVSAAAREAGRMYQMVGLPIVEEGTALLALVGEMDSAATEASDFDLQKLSGKPEGPR